MLSGLKNEIEKIDKLTDYNYLKDSILIPAVKSCEERRQITVIESKILRRAINNRIIKSGDIKDLFPNKKPPEISRNIRRLINKNMLIPEKENSRKYLISFANNYLLRGIISALDEKGFLPNNN